MSSLQFPRYLIDAQASRLQFRLHAPCARLERGDYRPVFLVPGRRVGLLLAERLPKLHDRLVLHLEQLTRATQIHAPSFEFLRRLLGADFGSLFRRRLLPECSFQLALQLGDRAA